MFPGRFGGQTRTGTHIAADELDWDYAPSGRDRRIHGKKYHFQDNPGSKGMSDSNATVYRKALFREYTDASFVTLKPRPDAWAHLGALAPLIRAEVGDTISVVFRNNASRACTRFTLMALFTGRTRQAPATRMEAVTLTKKTTPCSQAERIRIVVRSGEGGPGNRRGQAPPFRRHDPHVDEGRDINSGLIGAADRHPARNGETRRCADGCRPRVRHTIRALRRAPELGPGLQPHTSLRPAQELR